MRSRRPAARRSRRSPCMPGRSALRGRPEAVDGTSVMYCPRRTVLDKLLVDAARAAGAEVREATLVREVIRDGDRVVGVRAVDASGETIEARASLVIGADGLNSSVAGMVGAAMARSHPSLTCGFYAYWSGVPVDGVEFFLREGRDILVFPTHDGLTCIWVGRVNSDWSAYRADIEASVSREPRSCAAGTRAARPARDLVQGHAPAAQLLSRLRRARLGAGRRRRLPSRSADRHGDRRRLPRRGASGRCSSRWTRRRSRQRARGISGGASREDRCGLRIHADVGGAEGSRSRRRRSTARSPRSPT